MHLMPTPFQSMFSDRSVLVTGHTGFKGSWLTQWLLDSGAEIHGFALDPQPHELLYDQLRLSERISSDTRADIRNLQRLRETIQRTCPEFIFHLAAQPLVRLSFECPVDTFSINVLGTINLLEAIRIQKHPCNVICVTTDKCYENREWLHSYRESDAMGGYDPYSASKGCAELAIASYRNSFFGTSGSTRVASVRAGNVIGGGDWAIDRIFPDIVRAVRRGDPVPVRNKHATRPWQHVLEPLSGYLWLACHLDGRFSQRRYNLADYCAGFNFGPSLTSNRTVAEVVEEALKHLNGIWQDCSDPNAVHEASKLNLSIDKAFHMLDWQPTWDFATTIEKTSDWYAQEASGIDVVELTRQQIAEFESTAAGSDRRWATSPLTLD